MSLRSLLRWLQFGILGVPGCALFIGGAFVLLVEAMLQEHELFWPALAAIAVGCPILLIGIGSLHEPLYVLVFLAFPCGVLLWGTVSNEPAGSVLGGGLIALVVSRYLERHYQAKPSGKGRPTTACR